jgi:hypothetical protein
LHAAPALLHVPVAQRSIVLTHACLHEAVVVAHALRHAASLHAASQPPHWEVHVAAHEVHVDPQACLQSRVSSSHTFGMQLCSNSGAQVNTSSSLPAP